MSPIISSVNQSFGFATTSPKIVTNGLVLYLDAGQSTSYNGGTTWTDLSGRGNNGTLVNGVGYNSSNGGSLSFDGADDYTQITNNATINFSTNSFSLNCWVKTDQTGTTKMILSKGDSDAIAFGKAYNLYLGNGGTTWLFGVWRGTGDNSSVGSTQFVQIGTWVNLVGVYDSVQGTQRLYANTNLIGSTTRTAGDISVTNNLFVGSGANASADWDGNIAQVSIYNRALTAQEISQNYNALRGRFGI